MWYCSAFHSRQSLCWTWHAKMLECLSAWQQQRLHCAVGSTKPVYSCHLLWGEHATQRDRETHETQMRTNHNELKVHTTASGVSVSVRRTHPKQCRKEAVCHTEERKHRCDCLCPPRLYTLKPNSQCSRSRMCDFWKCLGFGLDARALVSRVSTPAKKPQKAPSLPLRKNTMNNVFLLSTRHPVCGTLWEQPECTRRYCKLFWIFS